MAFTNTGNAYVDALAAYRWPAQSNGSFEVSYFFDPSGLGGAWQAHEKALFKLALAAWSRVANVTFHETATLAGVDMAERKETNATWGANPPNADHEYPQGNPSTGRYNTSQPQWNTTELKVGGTVFSTFIHELGHGLGLNHPHPDPGDDALNFPGVTSASDSGDNSLNRRIFSVMSYVRDTDPASGTDAARYRYGHTSSPMAFDIAAIQALYGANKTTSAGPSTYTLGDKNDVGTMYSCIWDVSGLDEIAYAGARDATIDLRPATITNAPGGGGFLSSVDGINGGFTIAADFTNVLTNVGSQTGVIIENATGGSGNDRITGNFAANKLIGGKGNDDIFASFGNDTLFGGDGDDVLSGGNDTDTALFSHALSNYAVARNPSGSIVVEHLTGNEGTDTLFGVEFARFKGELIDLATFTVQVGSPGNDRIEGKYHRSDHLRGGAGNDTLIGDWIVPTDPPPDGPENDVLRGEAGNDVLDGVNGNDILDGGANNDTLHSWYVYDGKFEPDRLLGGSGIDLAIISRGTLNIPIVVNFTNPSVTKRLSDGTTVKDVERFEFFAGAGDDRITGGALADKLTGSGGDDVIDGGGGADRMDGGLGDDWFYVNVNGAFDTGGMQTGGDYVIENNNGGNDRVLARVSYRLEDGKEVETLSTDNPAGTAPIRLTGNEYDQAIVGNAGNNVIDGNPRNQIFFGQQGLDIMNGLGGNDIYHVRQPGDEVNEAARKGNDAIVVHLYTEAPGYVLKPMSEVEKISIAEQQFGNRFNLTGSNFNNTISGTNGINILNGLGGNDVLNGLDGNDTLLGGDGRDVIAGGMGTDTMTGAAGVDRFDFNSTLETRRGSLRDVITDFVHLVDDIDLSTINPGTASGAFAFLNAKGAQFTGAKGVVRWFQENPAGTANDRTIVEGDLDGDRFADFQIQINGLKTLTAADFFL